MSNRRGHYSSVGVLYSRSSLSECVEKAKQFDALYNFHGATGTVQWLKGEYAYLAPNGAASLLRRLCIKFDWLTDEDLLEPKHLERYHTLVVPHAITLPTQAHKTLANWVYQGGFLLVTGQNDLPLELIGISEIKWYQPEGYTAIKYREYNIIVGYRGFTAGICQPISGTRVLGSAYEVKNLEDEFNKPINHPLGPGVIRSKRMIYIPMPLFETFGAMLQGHVDFEDMRNWGHRYKYLDRLGRFVKDLLEDSGWKHLWRVRVKPWGEYHGVVVLRHDVDSSKDITYLDFERENQIPATYAILDDSRRQHWLKAVASHPTAEAAYHFDTGPKNTPLSSSLGKLRGTNTSTLKKTSRKGLWKQVRKARDELRIPVMTAQRHNSFFFYPEIVDGMDYLYKRELEVLGLGTMFRFTNFMYGSRANDDERTYVVQHPDTSVPFWFPFKLWYATTDDHHALRGWDITHVLEPEPWLTDLLLNQEECLEEGVYTLGFHPAHCWGESFRQEGNWDWFKYAVELGKSRGYLFATCKEVFERLNQWESLDFGLGEIEGWVENHHSPSPITVYLEHPHGKLFFKEKETYVESVNPHLTKIILANGDSIRFSLG